MYPFSYLIFSFSSIEASSARSISSRRFCNSGELDQSSSALHYQRITEFSQLWRFQRLWLMTISFSSSRELGHFLLSRFLISHKHWFFSLSFSFALALWNLFLFKLRNWFYIVVLYEEIMAQNKFELSVFGEFQISTVNCSIFLTELYIT